MAVYVEVRGVAVQPFADDVGQVTQREDIGGAVERAAILKREPLACLYFFPDWTKTRIIDYDLHGSGTRFQEEYVCGPEYKE